jgi:hypothetical protein
MPARPDPDAAVADATEVGAGTACSRVPFQGEVSPAVGVLEANGRTTNTTDGQRTCGASLGFAAAAAIAVVRVLFEVTRAVQLHFISPSPSVRKPVTDPG